MGVSAQDYRFIIIPISTQLHCCGSPSKKSDLLRSQCQLDTFSSYKPWLLHSDIQVKFGAGHCPRKFIWEALLRKKFDIQELFQFILLDHFCSTEIKESSLLQSFGVIRPVHFIEVREMGELQQHTASQDQNLLGFAIFAILRLRILKQKTIG